ncbi:GNAT family N-acetyltransferase [Legionella fallonii]|uniref:N-acetyltransferase domain-containing protein n=1 Tax=Legionella fallonii LLAP-10 TaxID=1212491 RepID=A0A098GBC9_9GAMM|nr:GNAT family N-acetyltransferase [Legionella fallonii]CEG58781.1 conserved protein of unknown function [Legionella fallonii LLAP-10]
MKYNFFAKNPDNLLFEWNAAKEKDWPILRRNFVAAYLCTYMEQAPPKVGENFARQAEILWEEACELPPKDALNRLMGTLIQPLQFYLFYQTAPLENEIDKIKEYLANPEKEITTVKQRLINLFKIKCYFEETFDQEKNKINNNNEIKYLILRFHEQPIAFFTCELNYKSGYTYLRFINISPAFNRLGLGKIILNEMDKYFSESLGLELYARKDNLSAIAFYKSCAFRQFAAFDFDEPSYFDAPILHFPQDDATKELEEHVGFQRRAYP